MSKSTKIAFIISLLLHISIFCLTGSGSTPPPTKKIEISLVMNQSKSEEPIVSREPVKEIKRRPVKKVVVKKKVRVVREKVRKKMLRAAIKPEPDRSPKNGHQASKKVCMTSQDPQPPLSTRVEKMAMEEQADLPCIGSPSLIQWYLGLIQQKIEEAKVYPEKARRNNQEGKVLVEFSILSGGMLKKATIIDSSKRRLLDRAALDTIGRAAPFSPIPTSLKMNEMTIRMPIVFDLE